MMGLAEEEMCHRQDEEASAVLRVFRLPLVRSVLRSVTLAYAGVKGRYPLLELMGGVAEVGVRSVSHEAVRRATAVLQSLEPQIQVANTFAHVGLNRLEKNFPILNQSADEVKEHLKDAFFVTLDDMQLWVADGLEGALVQLEHLTDAAWEMLQQLQDSRMGRAATSGLDDILSRLEDATVSYLPLPATLRLEWEVRAQQYEDEGDEDDPSLWTRVQSLLLHLSLQLYHRMMKDREQLQEAVRTLTDAGEKVGLAQVLALVGDLLLYLHSFMVALCRAEGPRGMSLKRVRSQAAMLAELSPVRQVWQLPVHIQHLLRDLQELSKVVLQLVVNVSPLYDLLQQPSDQEVEDFLNQEGFSSNGSSRRSSANSLFLKAVDGRPRRRRSLYSLATQGPEGRPDPPEGRPDPPEGRPDPPEGRPDPPEGHPDPPEGRPDPPEGRPDPPEGRPDPPEGRPDPPEGHPDPPEGRPDPPEGRPDPPEGHPDPPEGHPDPPEGRSSVKDPADPKAEGSTVPSDTELLLSPLQEFVSQSQKAFECLSPNEPTGSTNDPFL